MKEKKTKLSKHQQWIIGQMNNGWLLYCFHVLDGKLGFEPLLYKKGIKEEVRLKATTIKIIDDKGLLKWEENNAGSIVIGWNCTLTSTP